MPGPSQRPALAVVRDGNPGHRPVSEQVIIPPASFKAPKWHSLFPANRFPKKPIEPRWDDAEAQRQLLKRITRAERKNDTYVPSLDDDEAERLLEIRRARYSAKMAQFELAKVAIEGAQYCRKRAAEEWDRIVPILRNSVGLGDLDYSTVVDVCTVVARLEWCEVRLNREGLIVMGMRGACKNPLTTVASQYRAQLKAYIREMGLSPSARTGLATRSEGGDDDDDPFD